MLLLNVSVAILLLNRSDSRGEKSHKEKLIETIMIMVFSRLEALKFWKLSVSFIFSKNWLQRNSFEGGRGHIQKHSFMTMSDLQIAINWIKHKLFRVYLLLIVDGSHERSMSWSLKWRLGYTLLDEKITMLVVWNLDKDVRVLYYEG